MPARSSVLSLLLLIACPSPAARPPASVAPVVIGESFTIDSRVLGETRRVNIYRPPTHDHDATRYPVLYMPDGGLQEDFHHITGLVQVSLMNGTMRPFIVVGIENTVRRRDLTPPTHDPADLARSATPQVGGSAAFRRFLRDELMPEIDRRYRTTDETAIVGESLAGLFALETLFREPDLFATYVAISPSLWWNREALLREADAWLRAHPDLHKTLYLAEEAEQDSGGLPTRLAAILRNAAPPGLIWHHAAMPTERHATIFHPAALAAFRTVFAPPPAAPITPRPTPTRSETPRPPAAAPRRASRRRRPAPAPRRPAPA